MFHVKNIQGNQKIGNEKGRLGEEIACKFLIGKGFKIIDRNYRKKWGEIDIIANKREELHFIEVKSVSREMTSDEVSHETFDEYRPEDNIHPAKIKRISRTIQSYLSFKNISYETPWYFDAVTVKLDIKNKKAKVFLMDNLII